MEINKISYEQNNKLDELSKSQINDLCNNYYKDLQSKKNTLLQYQNSK